MAYMYIFIIVVQISLCVQNNQDHVNCVFEYEKNKFILFAYSLIILLIGAYLTIFHCDSIVD